MQRAANGNTIMGTEQVKKAAPSAFKKATGGKKSTGGWLGGAGGAQDLDKWYGERPPLPTTAHDT